MIMYDDIRKGFIEYMKKSGLSFSHIDIDLIAVVVCSHIPIQLQFIEKLSNDNDTFIWIWVLQYSKILNLGITIPRDGSQHLYSSETIPFMLKTLEESLVRYFEKRLALFFDNNNDANKMY